MCSRNSVAATSARVCSIQPSSSRAGMTTDSFIFRLTPRGAHGGLFPARVPLDKLVQNAGQTILHLPVREMTMQLAQVRNITDMIADAIGVLVAVPEAQAQAGQRVDGLQNGQAVAPSAAEVVYLATTRRSKELHK